MKFAHIFCLAGAAVLIVGLDALFQGLRRMDFEIQDGLDAHGRRLSRLEMFNAARKVREAGGAPGPEERGFHG